MTQSNIPRKSAHSADAEGGTAHGLLPEADSSADCRTREVMSYVADMATSLAELATQAREHEVAGMLHKAGRRARQAAGIN